MNRRPKLLAGSLVVLALTIISITAAAVVRLDFVDEFTVGHVILRTDSLAQNHNFWNGTDSGLIANESWTPAGTQPVGTASNVRMQTQFDVQDRNSECISATVSLARWRYTTNPPEGASCFPLFYTYTYQGSVSFTKNSCNYPAGDQYHSHHNLPEFNFASESSATPYTYRSYRVRQRLSANTSPSTIDDTGCFKIYWTP